MTMKRRKLPKAKRLPPLPGATITDDQDDGILAHQRDSLAISQLMQPNQRRLQGPLDRYVARGQISVTMYKAALRLRHDYCVAQSQPRLTRALDRPIGSGTYNDGANVTERQLMARQRFEAAMQSLGMGLKDLVLGVCCLDQPLMEWSSHYLRCASFVPEKTALVYCAWQYTPWFSIIRCRLRGLT